MILALLACLPPLALGWGIVRLSLSRTRPAWAQWALELALAWAIGTGLSSCLFFVWTWAGLPQRTVLLLEVAGAAAAIALARCRRGPSLQEHPSSFRWLWIMRLAVIACVLLWLAQFSTETEANPHGGWDAFSIWNVRAKFLANGASWRNAVSPDWDRGLAGASHPGYPLLLPAFVARTWVVLGDLRPGVPAFAGLAFGLAAAALLYGALTRLRSEASALAAAAALLAGLFGVQWSWQYADVPLSCYVLASLAMAAIAASEEWGAGPLVLSGLCAALAAWTKNEGIVVLLLLGAAVLWRGGVSGLARFAAGAAAPVLVLVLFKLFAAPPGAEGMLPSTLAQALSTIGNPSRWTQVASSFALNAWQLGLPWAHPVLLATLATLALGFGKVRPWLWVLAIPAGLLIADFLALVMTQLGLRWQLDTSNLRLYFQVLPGLLFGWFLLLRVPATAVQQEQRPPRSARKARQK